MEFEIKRYYNGSYFGIRHYSLPQKISQKIMSRFEDRILDLGRKKLGTPLTFARLLRRLQPKLINVDFAGLDRRYMISVFAQYNLQLAKCDDHMYKNIIMKIINQTDEPKKVLEEYFIFCRDKDNAILHLGFENIPDDIIEWFVSIYPQDFFTLKILILSNHEKNKKYSLVNSHLRYPEKITTNGIMNAMKNFYGIPNHIMDVIRHN